MGEPVIVEALRTPIGRSGGALREWRPDALLAWALDGLLARIGLAPERIDDLIIGCVTQFGEQSGNVARLGGLLAGVPASVPAVTVNRACGSSQQAIHQAAQMVAAGDAEYVVAGGVESMSRVPMFSDADGRGSVEARLAGLNPQLAEKYEMIGQGESAERLAERVGLSRAELDRYGWESHRRAAHAAEQGWLDHELIAVMGVDAGGQPIRLTRDEGVRPNVDLAKMASLKPAFRSGGVVTAATSSQISDGAALVLVADRERAVADGFRPRARFRARVVMGGDPTLQLAEVVPATTRALKMAGLAPGDLDWVEVNEAFAPVPLFWLAELGVDPARVNPVGGAIAHGHPLGATGAVLMAKLLHGLERTGGRFGLQVMCVARGMATATIIERL